MLFGKKEYDEYINNNQRVDLTVRIVNYEETGLNTEQITGMLVEMFGGVVKIDPENPRGLPYDPSIKSVKTHGDIMIIDVSVSGNKSEIYRIRNNFITLMHWCKVWRR